MASTTARPARTRGGAVVTIGVGSRGDAAGAEGPFRPASASGLAPLRLSSSTAAPTAGRVFGGATRLCPSARWSATTSPALHAFTSGYRKDDVCATRPATTRGLGTPRISLRLTGSSTAGGLSCSAFSQGGSLALFVTGATSNRTSAAVSLVEIRS